ncbi:20069_t:CDS:2 [Funneliformis geosporum]|uniref:20069_t:CDS:1 n=1 Tax=Funneliformis geosporum TaxID=1117311 RepID=A0A9W4WLR3_9GLOM|nr:20069_t:CDS:2 [Funneliformis geosporum]
MDAIKRDEPFHKQTRRLLSPAFSTKYVASLKLLMASFVIDLIDKVDDYLKQNIIAGRILSETCLEGNFIVSKHHPIPRKVNSELRGRVFRSMFALLHLLLNIDPYLCNVNNIRRGKDGQMSDFEIIDKILEFLIAGTEDTRYKRNLTMLLEIYNVKLPMHYQLKSLPYLNGVINETMRLWPVVLRLLFLGVGKSPAEDNKFSIEFLSVTSQPMLKNFYRKNVQT